MTRHVLPSMKYSTATSASEHIGEWWNLLILKEAMSGATRFDQFINRIGMVPSTLSSRLKALVQNGMLVRRRYSIAPERMEYLLTDKSQAFMPALLLLLEFGARHGQLSNCRVDAVHKESGAIAELTLTDRLTGKEILWKDFKLVTFLAEC